MLNCIRWISLLPHIQGWVKIMPFSLVQELLTQENVSYIKRKQVICGSHPYFSTQSLFLSIAMFYLQMRASIPASKFCWPFFEPLHHWHKVHLLNLLSYLYTFILSDLFPVFPYIYIYIYIYTHTYISHIYLTHTYIIHHHTHTHIYISHTHTHIYHTHIYIYHAHTHIYIYHAHTHIHTSHTHVSYTHTSHTHIYHTHTHIYHTHIYIYITQQNEFNRLNREAKKLRINVLLILNFRINNIIHKNNYTFRGLISFRVGLQNINIKIYTIFWMWIENCKELSIIVDFYWL